MPFQQLTDTELFALAKNENIQAFEVLYKRYWPQLTDAAYKRLQSRKKAEDLVQDLFLSLYTKKASLEFTVSLKAYLNQALKFKVLNAFRAEVIRTSYVKNSFFTEFCKNDFANAVEGKELQKRIGLILQTLPRKCRQVFLLSRTENLTNKEIALEMNISVSTVEKHIGKALKVLRENLQEYPV